AGGVFDAQNDAGIFSNGGAASSFTNAGTFRKSAGAGTTTVGIDFVNTGTTDVRTGTLNLSGPFGNFSSTTSTLTGGNFVVAGTLRFNDAHITTNAAGIVLDGPASQIVNQGGNDALTDFVSNTASGSFALLNGRHLTSTAFDNAGTLTVGAS